MSSDTHVHRVAIIGAGFSGLGLAIRLKQEGIEDFVVLDKESEVGGTWWVNTYPGCACDVPSHVYSYSFAPSPEWSSTFSPQSDISRYLRDCADRFGVRPHVRLNTRVGEARWLEDEGLWELDTEGPDGPRTVRARVLVPAVGGLSVPSIPELPGLERFQGATFHSAQWDHDHDLTGERVAVVGTGASAVQFVPAIQPRVGKLHVFQRTPPWIMPRRDRPLSSFERRLYRRVPVAQKVMREAIFWGREAFLFGFRHPKLMAQQQKIAELHLRRQVKDPVLREQLTPNYRMGCKRILLSNDYLPSLSKENVEVIGDAIAEVRERSIVDTAGVEREIDAIVLGTGFHVADFPAARIVKGRDGVSLADAWDTDGIEAHRGTAIAGFPNMFMVIGPNTGLGHNSIVYMIEALVEYVIQALRTIEAAGPRSSVSALPAAQAKWNEDIQEHTKGTVWTEGGCVSWYLDSEGVNRALWPGHSPQFAKQVERFDAAEYDVRRAPEREAVAT